jgi:hypothetical protein
MSEDNRQQDVADYSTLNREMRLELLVGHMADAYAQMRPLAELRLRANASAESRRTLDYLVQLDGAIWQLLGKLLDEVQGLRSEVGGGSLPV